MPATATHTTHAGCGINNRAGGGGAAEESDFDLCFHFRNSIYFSPPFIGVGIGTCFPITTEREF